MAAKSNGARGSNGSNGHRIGAGRDKAGYAVDDGRVMDQTRQVAVAAEEIGRIADDVSAGADAQLRSLDTALAGVTQMTGALKEAAE